ncbi:RNA polymerase subunit sigma-70 [candidate division KSB3 bacterium]|uniref:RNA polymerase subunit sigma-70 n=1 Tax=candidate division KSB3 bacterium TaxID=2044937 RepID=A0A2G6E865_9BACT|nr:MAG: RNA polymerase subunit sigma-70 [candidate division KSB3 bacterium]PIE30570.1 MAG: RNA polymerase subunit sigma-70 [candidate division KSB3 bacterium]
MATQIIAVQHPFHTLQAPAHSIQKRKQFSIAELEGMTDNELIDLTLEGRDSAFEILVTRHQRQMYALAFKMVRNHEDASDIAQDVFLKAYEVLGSFQKKSSFHTWLYRITANFCINHLRRNKSKCHVELESYHAVEQAAMLEELDKQEVRDVLNAAIQRLPEKQQKTVFLRIYQELPYKEISEILGCSVGTVKANYFHAVKNLRRYMKSTVIAHAS